MHKYLWIVLYAQMILEYSSIESMMTIVINWLQECKMLKPKLNGYYFTDNISNAFD